jgi:hypothetical protein
MQSAQEPDKSMAQQEPIRTQTKFDLARTKKPDGREDQDAQEFYIEHCSTGEESRNNKKVVAEVTRGHAGRCWHPEPERWRLHRPDALTRFPAVAQPDGKSVQKQ